MFLPLYKCKGKEKLLKHLENRIAASGIRQSCGRYKISAAKEAIRQDLERASDKYEASKSGTAFRNGDETQEDNDTSAQPQTQTMGAALREPQRDEMSMR